MRPVIACVILLFAACTPEQSRNIGNQPKKAMDSVSNRVNDTMQQGGQGSDRLKEGDSK
jgi:hypothetical protein